jgi:hypothetical protein
MDAAARRTDESTLTVRARQRYDHLGMVTMLVLVYWHPH